MTIEKLEALERAKDDPTCSADEFCERCTKLAYAQQAAFPALLAVAKAAKLVKAANARRANAQVQDCCVREDYEQSMGHACDQLTRALEQLEATP